MDSIIAIVIIIAVVGLAAFYIIKAKKSGKKCIGCPYADSCGKKCVCRTNTNNEESES